MPKNTSAVIKKSRRADFHDYQAKGYYHITATVIDPTVKLSSMPKVDIDSLKNTDMIIPVHSELGELILKEIKAIPKYHPKLTINRFVIMPDHIHFVVCVKERLNKKLGNELTGFFGACSAHYSRLKGLISVERLFHTFHDNIIFNKVQLARAVRYVEDNPRRLIIKRMFLCFSNNTSILESQSGIFLLMEIFFY